jgi:hypothetical protein
LKPFKTGWRECRICLLLSSGRHSSFGRQTVGVGDFFAFDELVCFMAFSRQQEDISRLAPGEGILNRFFPVRDADAFPFYPGPYVINDVQDIFPDGIVRRQYHQVTVF